MPGTSEGSRHGAHVQARPEGPARMSDLSFGCVKTLRESAKTQLKNRNGRRRNQAVPLSVGALNQCCVEKRLHTAWPASSLSAKGTVPPIASIMRSMLRTGWRSEGTGIQHSRFLEIHFSEICDLCRCAEYWVTPPGCNATDSAHRRRALAEPESAPDLSRREACEFASTFAQDDRRGVQVLRT